MAVKLTSCLASPSLHCPGKSDSTAGSAYAGYAALLRGKTLARGRSFSSGLFKRAGWCRYEIRGVSRSFWHLWGRCCQLLGSFAGTVSRWMRFLTSQNCESLSNFTPRIGGRIASSSSSIYELQSPLLMMSSSYPRSTSPISWESDFLEETINLRNQVEALSISKPAEADRDHVSNVLQPNGTPQDHSYVVLTHDAYRWLVVHAAHGHDPSRRVCMWKCIAFHPGLGSSSSLL